jgi:glyoxylase-like metal-dependent hydrolase (beta-lactamase superfamily II)
MATDSGIKALKLEMNEGGNTFFVHAALLWDEHDVILVDTGVPGHLEIIRKALEQESIRFEQLTKVIITHHDLDHIGSLPNLISESGGRIKVFAHEFSKPYILGEVPILKMGILVPPSKIDVTLQDGDIIPYCGDIEVISTPGHSPDHISLYHKPSKTLISGDALTSNNGVLMPPYEAYTPDMEQALQSVAKLLNYDIETVITYHGGVCTERIKQRLTIISKGKE